MKKYISPMLGILCALSSVSGFSVGGDHAGNGGDTLTSLDESMWFTGARASIQYCINVSSEFGFNENQLSPLVEKAFATWDNYVRIRKPNHGDTFYLPPQKLVHMQKCTGTEDLKFYFGSSAPEVVKAKSGYYNPVAFANRTKYDRDAFWGKGFVWFANPGTVRLEGVLGSNTFPNWKQAGSLFAVVLHEVGHIYGCGHIPNTIMRSDLVALISDDLSTKNLRTKIDHERELFRGIGDLNVSSQLRVIFKNDVDQWVQNITGFLPDDTRLVQIAQAGAQNFEITIGTKAGVLKILSEMATSGVRAEMNPVFKVGGYQDENLSYMLSGSVMSNDGQKSLVQIEYNMSGAPNSFGDLPIKLYGIVNGERVFLADFASAL